MNIHEHQAKKILKKYGATVPEGVFSFDVKDLIEKAKILKTEKYVLKAQIHAGGRGKAGGVKIVENIQNLEAEARKLLGKTLITHQTGPSGREVKRLYVEDHLKLAKNFIFLALWIEQVLKLLLFQAPRWNGYEEVANKTPEKIITTKVDLNDEISDDDCKKIIKVFNLDDQASKQAVSLIKSIYKMFIDTDANLVEINPLILTKDNNMVCLDAKMNFDDNALFKHPDIVELRDLNEEEDNEIEASKHDLAYIKLDGSIGCMVNGAGLAMATMDIIKLYGEEPANFLDVGGGLKRKKFLLLLK